MAPEFLSAIDDGTLHVSLLEALRTTTKGPGHVSRDELVRRTILELAPTLNITPQDAESIARQLKDAYDKFANTTQGRGDVSKSGEHGDVLRFEAAFWDLVRRGVVYPRLGEALHGGDIPWTIKWLVVTPRGRRVLELDAAHPAHADFVARVVAGCPGLPSEVPARLEDAHDCFNNGLHRAAVVMLRLAYEQMIRVIYDEHGLENHVSSNLKPGKRPTASTLLEGLVDVLKKVPDPPEGVANMALHIADVIRQDGNTAAHDWVRDFADAAEVEELLILAGRNVRRLWGMKERLP